MKNKLLAFGFILAMGSALAYEKIYIPNTSSRTYSPYHPYSVFSSYNNPYSRMYSSPTNYVRYNSGDIRRIRRLHNIMRLQRLKNNYLTWDTFQRFNPSSKGSMTGYSVPVTNDIYNQMGITPYDPKNLNNVKSTAAGQELYSMPTGNETYYRNGEVIRDLGGVSGRTGVTVIYD